MAFRAEKICPFCTAAFPVTSKNPDQIHCSIPCYHGHRHAQALAMPKKPRAKRKRPSTEHARALHRVHSARYYASHKAEHAKRMSEYHARTAEQGRKRTQRWRKANPEKRRRQYVQEYARNPGAHKRRRQRWVRRFPDGPLQAQRRYYANHPERVLAAQHRREAKKRAATRIDLSEAQWREIVEMFNHRCAYCGCRLVRPTMDHLTPYNFGGAHTLWNVVPACGPCNSRKRDGPVLAPVQPLLLTFAPARTAG